MATKIKFLSPNDKTELSPHSILQTSVQLCGELERRGRAGAVVRVKARPAV